MITIKPYDPNPRFYYQLVPGRDPSNNEILLEDVAVLKDITKFFSIFDKSLEHTYEYKNRLITGNIDFINQEEHFFLRGLMERVLFWFKKNKIEVKVDVPKVKRDVKVSREGLIKFIDSLGLPFKPHDFQIDMLEHSLNEKKVINLSCVGSGKSLVLYILSRLFTAQGKKGIILTPDLMLKEQLYSDFEDYFYSREQELVHEIETGFKLDEIEKKKKELEKLRKARERDSMTELSDAIQIYDKKKEIKSVNIVNFQAIMNQEEELFEQFDYILVDEVHKAGTASSYFMILETMLNAEFFVGFTGTKPRDPIPLLTLDGLFGQTKEIISLNELVERGLATPYEVQPIRIVYPKKDVDFVWGRTIEQEGRKLTYAQEAKYVRLHKERCELLCRIAMNLSKRNDGSPLIILVKNIDAQQLFMETLQELQHENVYKINGNVKGKDREKIRKMASQALDIIIIGGESILGTGINIPALTYIMKMSGKAEIELIQAIGRSTRKFKNKEKAVIIDVVDDLRWVGPRGGERLNYHVKHHLERLKTYRFNKVPLEQEKVIKLGVL